MIKDLLGHSKILLFILFFRYYFAIAKMFLKLPPMLMFSPTCSFAIVGENTNNGGNNGGNLPTRQADEGRSFRLPSPI